MSQRLAIGGMANIQAVDKRHLIVAMTALLDGGVYAQTVSASGAVDGKKHFELRHYLVADDGSYLYTQGKSGAYAC